MRAIPVLSMVLRIMRIAMFSKPGIKLMTEVGTDSALRFTQAGPSGSFIGIGGLPSGVTLRSRSCFRRFSP